MTEAEIRSSLVAQLSAMPEGDGAAFIAELFLDRFSRRADLVVANGVLAAYEIKSEFDNLDRLPGQLETYSRLFEKVSIVCADKHMSAVRQTVPARVGIWRVTPSGDLKQVRAARRMSIRARASWLSFLPVTELRSILRMHCLQTGGSRNDLIDRCETIPVAAVRQFTLEYLKRRESAIDARCSARPMYAASENRKADAHQRVLEFLLSYGKPTRYRTATPRQA